MAMVAARLMKMAPDIDPPPADRRNKPPYRISAEQELAAAENSGKNGTKGFRIFGIYRAWEVRWCPLGPCGRTVCPALAAPLGHAGHTSAPDRYHCFMDYSSYGKNHQKTM